MTMFDTEDMDLTSPMEGFISSKAVEHMADNLALDEMHSLHFGDVQFCTEGPLEGQVQNV
jgi:hypothetical protein